MASDPRTILFVCLGNICRSPMAEGLLKRMLAERGLADRYRVRSAGIIARRDHVSPLEAVRAAAEHAVDLAGHLSTPLTPALLRESDLVVAMDRMNAEHILNLVPELSPRLRLLNQFAAGARSFDVPDPIGCSMEVYRESYRQIAAGVEGLVASLATEELGPRSEAGAPSVS